MTRPLLAPLALAAAAACGGSMAPISSTTGSHRTIDPAPPTAEPAAREVPGDAPVPRAEDPRERLIFVKGGSLWIMGPDGEGAARLTTRGSRSPDEGPVLSPRGDAVAFSANRDGAAKIYVLTLDGYLIPATDGANGGDSQPAWDPEGRRLAFMRGQPGGQRDLLVVDVDAGGPPTLVLAGGDDAPGWAGAPAWSPDGETIALAADRREGHGTSIWAVNVVGGGLRRLTRAPATAPWRRDVRPAWSPDGTRLAFASNRHATSESQAGDLDLYVLTVADGAVARLTRDPGVADEPCWSPDGRRIYFTSTRDVTAPYAVEIYVMGAAGGEQRRLTRDERPQNASPSAGRLADR